VAKQLKADYPELANGLLALLTRLKAAEVAVSDINRNRIGRTRCTRPPMARRSH
jgi:hypothetical protein